MNLVLDIGNSRIKLAVFQSGKMLYHSLVSSNDFIPFIEKLQQEYPEVQHLLVSNVGKIEEKWQNFLVTNFKTIHFLNNLKLPFLNLYQTKSTLGEDRKALVAAAQYHFPKKNVLVIDAGTCITYDFLNKDNEYLGGAISPGINMRMKALHTFTEKLPLIEAVGESYFLGKSTEKAIRSGVVLGASLEIDGFIALYKMDFENLTVILTGGDRLLLSKTIKNSIFAPSNFLLEGLNAILEFNKTQ